MKASRFMYMVGGAFITTGITNIISNPEFSLLVAAGVIGTFIATGLDRQGY